MKQSLKIFFYPTDENGDECEKRQLLYLCEYPKEMSILSKAGTLPCVINENTNEIYTARSIAMYSEDNNMYICVSGGSIKNVSNLLNMFNLPPNELK